MKKLDSKLFKNNVINKNTMTKVQGGQVLPSRLDCGRSDIQVGDLFIVLESLPEVVIKP